jgi:hypothetical protein
LTFLSRSAHEVHVFPSSKWPSLAEATSVLKLFRTEFDDFLPTNNPQAQAAWSSPYPAAFRKFLEQKTENIREATEQGKYAKVNGPLWLLVVCYTRRDLSSEIFGSEEIKYSVEESGFDFANSPFDEIWLMQDSRGLSDCIYP